MNHLDFSQSLAAFEQAVQAFGLLGELLQGAFGEWGEAIKRLSAWDNESVYRRYAARYNLRHPNRKISWRRLNRKQRAAAWEVFGDG